MRRPFIHRLITAATTIILFASYSNAFSVVPRLLKSRSCRATTSSLRKVRLSSTILSMSDTLETTTDTEMVTMISKDFTVQSKPMGVVLEEIETGGVYCSECDPEGSAYAAGIREGDVLVSLDGNERILSSTLEDAMSMLAETVIPLPIKVYRPMKEGDNAKESNTKVTVKMAPKRMPSAQKNC